MKNTKKFVGFFGLLLVNFIAMFLIAGVGVYSYTVAELFGSVSSVGMIFTLECMARGVSIPLGGKFGDKIGHKKLFLIALGLYIASYTVVSLSQSFWVFTIARMVSGFAWGLFMMNSFVLISAIFGQADAPKYSGYNQSLTTVAMIIAAPVTGIFCSFNWRIEFYAAIAILAIGFVMCAYGLPDIPPTTSKGTKLDVPGVILTAITLIAFTLAMNFGASMGWTSPLILKAFAVTIIGVILLMVFEKRSEDPVFPLKLLKNNHYLCILMLALIFAVISGTTSYAPTYAQYALGYSSFISGLITTPGLLVAVFLTAYFGSRVAKTKKYKSMVMIWAITTLVGSIILVLLGFVSSATAGLIVLFAGCFALSTMNSASQIAPYTYPMAVLEPRDLASGLAFVGLAGALGSSVSGSICGALMNSELGLVSVFYLPIICSVIMLVYAVRFKDVQ